MSIFHADMPSESDEPFVFAELGNLTVSVCAPKSWPEAKIEAWVNAKFPVRGAWPYEAVDKSKILRGTGPTPNPCNHAPDRRQHWMLFRGGTMLIEKMK